MITATTASTLPPSQSPSSSSISLIRKLIRKLNEDAKRYPNVIVTTKHTRRLMADAASDSYPLPTGGMFPMPAQRAFFGIRVEDFQTVKECLDRMESPEEGERLQLVLVEDIPADCIFHPFISKLVEKMSAGFGVQSSTEAVG